MKVWFGCDFADRPKYWSSILYKVIGTKKSRAFRVLWMLEELKEGYDLITAPPRSDIARQYNQTGKIPALVDGEDVFTDSVAIMTYLADKHHALTAPAGTPDRARQDAETCWLLDEFDAILWAAAKHSFVLPEGKRVAQIIPSLHTEFERNAKTLTNRLGANEFLMGNKITLPDLLAVHCIGWAFGADFPKIPDQLKDYSNRLRSRPAFRAAADR